jgi:hypothetical protein
MVYPGGKEASGGRWRSWVRPQAATLAQYLFCHPRFVVRLPVGPPVSLWDPPVRLLDPPARSIVLAYAPGEITFTTAQV